MGLVSQRAAFKQRASVHIRAIFSSKNALRQNTKSKSCARLVARLIKVSQKKKKKKKKKEKEKGNFCTLSLEAISVSRIS